ncbi:MAG: hypothetical protein HYY84_05865 [Deltaproteobacteria bacterium]|nr:hypothetical protein [Deltaproteobacteria bacterium]
MPNDSEFHLARLLANRTLPSPRSLRAARAVVKSMGSLREVARASEAELTRAGLSPPAASRVHAAFSLVRFGLEGRFPRGSRHTYAQQTFERLRHLELEKGESFYAVPLNVGFQELAEPILVSKGTTAVCPLRPSDFFSPMVRLNATYAVAVHNHPTGRSDPSDDDIFLTQRLIWAGDIVGVHLFDHLIISGGSFTSLRETEWLCELWDRPIPDEFVRMFVDAPPGPTEREFADKTARLRCTSVKAAEA